MNLLNLLKNQDLKTVNCFKVKKYLPSLGFLLFCYFRKAISSKINFINNQENLEDYKIELAQTFLGNKNYYWLSDISLYKKPSQKSWEKLIFNYNGPNSIFFFSSQKLNSKDISVIEIPEYITKKEFISLAKILFHEPSLNNSFINVIFKSNSKIELENAILLLNYYPVIGKSSKAFINNWLNKVIVNEQSTFLLAQYFFSQDKKLFFNYWLDFESALPIEFWITFFSEQIWQAIIFVKRATLSITEAKKQAKRLPFSFINKDWQLYKNKIDFLIKAHSQLYLIDYKIKNGSSYSLDLWLHKFFLQNF